MAADKVHETMVAMGLCPRCGGAHDGSLWAYENMIGETIYHCGCIWSPQDKKAIQECTQYTAGSK